MFYFKKTYFFKKYFIFLEYLRDFFYFSKKRRINKINQLVSFSLNNRVVRSMQISEEISELLKILKNKDLKRVIEIGTAKGGTLFLLSRISSKKSTIVSIDLPKGRFGGGYPFWKIPLYKSFAQKNQRIHLLRVSSQNKKTVKEVKKIMQSKPVDFLFIDGDHSYEGVKKDFYLYSPFVKKGGLIAFHDIVSGPEENVGGVPKFWQEIKGKYKTKEIVKNYNQGGYGIGLLYIK